MKKSLLLASALSIAGIAMAQGNLITEQPEGTLRTFHAYSMSAYLEWGYETADPVDGLARQVVFADNGDVFFKDPVSKAPRGTWIKGTLKDGVITVETPQVIDYTTSDSGETTEWTVQRLKGNEYYDEYWEEWDIDWEIDNEKTTITYTYDGNSIVQDEQNVKLCLMADGEPMIYGDYNVVYSSVDETAAKIPENTTTEKWSLFYNTYYGNQIDVAFDGDDMYLKGFWAAQPSAVIKGRIDGDKFYIPSKQYIGYLTSGDYGYYVYLMSATIDDSGWMNAYITTGDDVVFNYDKEARKLTLASEVIPVVRYGKTEGVADYNVKAWFSDMNMAYIDHIGRPSTPEIASVTRYIDTGWGWIEPIIYPKDEFGNALDVNYLYYSVWMDGELYVLDPANTINDNDYEFVTEPITEVAYTFDNDHGISKRGSDAQKYLRFYDPIFTEIGVQSIYYNPETGERATSPIVYYNMDTYETRIEDPTVGVESLIESEPVAVEYYDLSGNKVGRDFKGIFVKVATFSDGSVKTAKMINR